MQKLSENKGPDIYHVLQWAGDLLSHLRFSSLCDLEAPDCKMKDLMCHKFQGLQAKEAAEVNINTTCWYYNLQFCITVSVLLRDFIH